MKSRCLCVTLAVLALGASAAVACTPMGAGRLATADGSVMVSHTCDNWYDARLKVVPGGTHKPGEMVPVDIVACMDTRPGVKLTRAGEVPQVARTYTYFHIGYPFMNEKGVVMGEHTWTGRDEVQSPQGMFYIENLEALALQRASTAREAIAVMGELAEKYGYGDGGEGLMVADGKELWYFEICGAGLLWTRDSGKPGAQWAARRVPDDRFIVCANRSRLGVIDFGDRKNVMTSKGLTDLAEKMGWWKKGEPFNFSLLFDPENYGQARDFGCSRREWRAFSMVAPSAKLTPGSSKQVYPFSIKPDHKLSVQDFQKIYRDHLDGTPYDATKGLAAGPFGDPYRWRPQSPKNNSAKGYEGLGWERCIATPQCSYSFIAQCRAGMPAGVGTVLWFGLAAPDTTVYVPVYAGAAATPKGWSDFDRVRFNTDCAWWAFNFVQQWCHHRFDLMMPEIAAKQAEIEKSYFDAQKAFEEKAAKAFAKSHQDGVKMVTEYTDSAMERLQKDWWAFAWDLVSRYGHGPYVIQGDKIVSPGYPTEWLEAVKCGDGQKSDVEAGR